MSSKLPEQMEQQIAIIVQSFDAVIQEFLSRHKVEHVCFEFHKSLNESPRAVFLVKDPKYDQSPSPSPNTYLVDGNDEVH